MRKTICTLMLATSLGFGLAPLASAEKTPKPLPNKHRAWTEATTQLEHTKKMLLADKAKDVNGHKARALVHIQQAMQELRQATQGDRH